MGKTRETYRDRLNRFETDWQTFRRALVKQYQPHWDEVVRQAHQQAMAAGNQNPVEPKWGIVFSVLVSQEQRIAELEANLVEEMNDGDE